MVELHTTNHLWRKLLGCFLLFNVASSVVVQPNGEGSKTAREQPLQLHTASAKAANGALLNGTINGPESESGRPETKNTASAYWCGFLYTYLMIGAFVYLFGCLTGKDEVTQAGNSILCCGAILSSVYGVYTGLAEDVLAGAKFSKEMARCEFIGLYAGIAIAICVFFSCVTALNVVIHHETVKKMDKEVRRSNSVRIRTPAEEGSWETKMEDAFNRADRDKNGSLDLTELRDVIFTVVELNAEQIKRVKEDELFQEAFEKYDKNKDHLISLAEFKQVVRYVELKGLEEA